MNLRIHRLAIAEIEQEVDYYEACQHGLGTALEGTIDAALIRIARFPAAAPTWKHRADRRVLTLPKFPFTIPYQITATEIVVLALAHTSRRPGYWNRQLPGESPA